VLGTDGSGTIAAVGARIRRFAVEHPVYAAGFLHPFERGLRAGHHGFYAEYVVFCPHPHIGLATVTYLFDGRVMHRDSEGNALEITPGAMNLMTAGRGIAHSERSPASARQGTEGMFGIQSWIALPQGHEETAPSFQHFDAASLPVVEDGGVRARIIAGSAFGRTSPVGMLSEWLYAEVLLGAG